MINLDIKNQRQAPRSSDCGPVCLKMILDSLKIEKTLEEINNLCNKDLRGTLEPDLVLALHKLNILSILYLVPDGTIIKSKYITMSPKKLSKSLKLRASKVKNDKHNIMSDPCRGFRGTAKVAEQGTCVIGMVTRDIIQAELDKGNPWIVAVESYPLYQWRDEKQRKLSHFIIIQGYDGNEFIVNDPSAELGGIYRIHCDHLMYCLHHTEGGAILVKNK